METTLDYHLVPNQYPHCFVANCPKATKCLHHLVGEACTNERKTLTIFNPKLLPENLEKCPNFQKSDKIRIAWGIQQLYTSLPYGKAMEIKRILLCYFGKTAYYRIRRKEKPILPDDMDYIRSLFRSKGILELPCFDSYSHVYEW